MQLSSLAYFCLMMTFGSLWIHRSAGLWGSFLLIAFSLAIYSGVAQPFSLLVIVLLFALFWFLKNSITGGKRHFLTLTAIALAAGLSYHWIPGFCNWQITPYFHLHFDTPLMGLFSLIFLVKPCQTKEDWIKVGLKAVPLILIFLFGLAALALGTGAIHWQLKLPSHLFLRIIANLFLVTIPEEAFFRGFVQKEISQQLGTGIFSKILGITGAALLFTLFHLGWMTAPLTLALVFAAGIIYGLIYELSGYLEGSIICHWGVNTLLLLFFSSSR